MARFLIILSFLFYSTGDLFSQQTATKIIATNNLSNKDEIWDLLGRGISSYEVDIMYIYGELYVTASMPDSIRHSCPTLKDAYLFPLYSNLKKQGNLVNGDTGTSFILLNVHNEFKKSNSKLKSSLMPLSEFVTFYNGGWHEGKMRMLVKDKNLRDEIKKDGYSCLGIVGGLSDLDNGYDYNQMPLIEIDFLELTSWGGLGNIPFPDFVKIKDIVNKIHLKGRKVCITNCPNYKTAWDVLITSKVDFISTNDPINVSSYLNERKQ